MVKPRMPVELLTYIVRDIRGVTTNFARYLTKMSFLKETGRRFKIDVRCCYRRMILQYFEKHPRTIIRWATLH